MVVKLIVKDLVVGPLQIELCDDDKQFQRVTVLQLKEKVAERFPEYKGHEERIRLVFLDKYLDEDSALLAEYGVQHMSVLHMVLKCPGGGPPQGEGDGGMGDKGGKNRSKEMLFSL